MVYSIVPEAGTKIAGTVQLSAYAADNDKVASVEFALRSREEGSTKIPIQTVNVNTTAGTVACSLDSTLYPNGEYDLCAMAKDENGNTSSELASLIVIHNVTLDTPELYAAAGDWCVNLHCTLSDSLNFVIYRKCQQTEQSFTAIHSGTGTFMFRDVNVDPRYTYIYQAVVTDAAGNRSQSVLKEAKPNAVDSLNPFAVIHTGTTVLEAYEAAFSGLGSTDNDRIARYTWDFGDGSGEVSGPSPKHAYQNAGEYLVKFTVEDASGNTDYATAKVTVLPRQDAGKAIVTVCNAAGTPLKDVVVYVNSSTSDNDMARTDDNGKAVIMQKPGTYQIALYKPGYVATEESVEIELYGDREFSYILAEGETIAADFTVRQMDFDEIAAAGIDLSDPENQHMVTVQTKLTFEYNYIPRETIPMPMRHVNSASSLSGGGSRKEEEGHTTSNPGTLPGQGNPEPEPDLYYTIYFTQSISWLKDMYEATLILYNNLKSEL